MTTRIAIAIAVLVAGLAASVEPALAQPPGATPRSVTDGEPAPGPRRERVRKRIRAMRAWYLTEELGLNDEDAARLFPVLGDYDERIATVHRRGVQLRRELRRVMSAARPDQREVDSLLDDLLTHYDNLYRVQRERLVALRKVIRPSQSAKLILMLPRLDDAVRREIQRATRSRRPGSPDDRSGPRDRPRRSRMRGEERERGSAESPAPFGDPF